MKNEHLDHVKFAVYLNIQNHNIHYKSNVLHFSLIIPVHTLNNLNTAFTVSYTFHFFLIYIYFSVLKNYEEF